MAGDGMSRGVVNLNTIRAERDAVPPELLIWD